MSSPRVWLITGSSTGFGRGIAEVALKNGDKVIATLRKPEILNDLAAQYSKEQLVIVKMDVTKPEEISAAFATAKDTFGRLDVVLSNAGQGIVGEFEATGDDLARSLFEVNFWGAVNVTREAITFFRDVNKPAGGKLFNMSSMFGIDACPGAGWYSATKFATEAVTDALVKELDPAWNIKVVSLCPAWFKTPLVTSNYTLLDLPEAYSKNPALTSVAVRKAFESISDGTSPLLGDADKLSVAVYEISKTDNLPQRIPLGWQAQAAFKSRAEDLKANLEASTKWSENLGFVSL